MEYQEFLQHVMESVQKKAGADCTVRLAPVLKNNISSVDTITIQSSGGNVSPAIYLAPYYRSCQAGTSVEEIARQIVEFHRKNAREGTYDLSFYMDFSQVRKRIVYRLVNYERNREMLSQIPHRRFLDLAAIYYYKMEDDTFGDASILIKNEHMKIWDADLEELDDAAVSNTARLMPYECICIADMIQEMTGIKAEELDEEQIPLYVLTNTEKSFGAAVILYQTVLEAVGERLHSDYFVLPSSVHECMLVPAVGEMKPDELRKIVCEINEECVAEEEILGDTVYRYDREKRELTAAASGAI